MRRQKRRERAKKAKGMRAKRESVGKKIKKE